MELRTIIIGGYCGKSYLTLQFIQGNLPNRYTYSIEDSYRKLLVIDNEPVMLDLMDVSGQEEYSQLRLCFMKAAQSFIVMYSVTYRRTFDSLRNYITEICKIKNYSHDELQYFVPIIIVGNKIDLHEERQVSFSEGLKYAESLNLPFFEISVTDNINVHECFTEIIRESRWKLPLLKPEYIKSDNSCMKELKLMFNTHNSSKKQILLYNCIDKGFENSSIWIIKQILPHNLNQQINGTTFLHRAVIKKNKLIIINLLQNGMDIRIKDNQNKTVYEICTCDTISDILHNYS